MTISFVITIAQAADLGFMTKQGLTVVGAPENISRQNIERILDAFCKHSQSSVLQSRRERLFNKEPTLLNQELMSKATTRFQETEKYFLQVCEETGLSAS